jgi:branched-chain amino acid transport system ATP-binding protein
MTSLLEVDNVSVSFGGIQALRGVSCRVEEGQFVGLIGPNGAGKSTLLGVLTGLITRHKGTVHLSGKDVTSMPPHKRARLGTARTFQRLDLWSTMSVFDNVRTAAEFSGRWQSDVRPEHLAHSLIEQLGLEDVASTNAGDLPTGLARVVEVARAMALQPKILLLDEPSAGLDDGESKKLAQNLVAVAKGGTAVLLVEHHVEMVLQASSYVYVLDFGTLIAEGPPAEVRAMPKVQEAYLGAKHVVSA